MTKWRKIWIVIFKLIEWFRLPQHKRSVMTIHYTPKTNQIECLDWLSVKIPPFSGDLTPELWDTMPAYCRVNGVYPETSKAPTTIYIWNQLDDGSVNGNLAYNEPVKNYLEDISLLQTGQGFGSSTEIRYGQSSALKCNCCGHKFESKFW